MKYDVQIYIGKSSLPSFGSQALIPSKVSEFLSTVLYRQLQKNSINEFRILVTKSVDDSSSVLSEGVLNLSNFNFKDHRKK